MTDGEAAPAQAPPGHQQDAAAAAAQMQELQETVSRLSSHKGVDAVLILNRNGDILAESSKRVLRRQQQRQQQGPSSSGNAEGGGGDREDEDEGIEHAKMTKRLIGTANSYLRSLDEDDEVSFLQIRSKHNRELMIAPHQGFVLAVLKR